MDLPVVNKDKRNIIRPLLKSTSHPTVFGVGITILTFLIIFSLMLTAVAPERYDLVAGDISPHSIAAIRDVEDRIATTSRVNEARDKVPEIYTLDQTTTADIIATVHSVFAGIDNVRALAADRLRQWEQAELDRIAEEDKTEEDDTQEHPGESSGVSPDSLEESTDPVIAEPEIMELIDDDFYLEAGEKLLFAMSNDDIFTMITAEQREINTLKVRLISTMAEMLERGIKKEQLTEFKSNLRDEIQVLTIPNEVKLLGINISVPLLQANLLYDPEKTMAEKQKAASRVEKVMYKKGQFIVQAGQPVTETQLALLSELGLLKDENVDMPLFTGIGLFVLLIIGFLILYFTFFERELLHQPLLLLMISLIMCSVLGISYITSHLNYYLLPAAMGGMLLAILLRPRVGMVMNVALALLAGLMLGGQLGVVVMVLSGGMMGICMLNTMQQRNTIVWAGLGVGIFNTIAVGAFEMITVGGWVAPLTSSLWGMVCGLLVAVLTIGILPIYENLFGVITPLKLVELSNPNQPVLKRLLMETPGTYHHSIIVANLAENAADAVGANGLLARVGAYYHDIGKLERPYYFKENQLYAENPHDKLDPMLSTRIILSHTLSGIEMARKYKVPNVLHDFILQHHGTTPVVYFYHKAKNQNQEDNKEITLDSFRYSGPKPNSKETAIVMMADTIEAAVRTLPDHTPKKVDDLVRKLIKEKMEDGQLDDCHLTLKDLNLIAVAFSSVICGIFHERVKYPEVDLKEVRGEQ